MAPHPNPKRRNVAKFILKHDTTFIMSNEIQQIVVGPQGPTVVVTPSRTVKIPSGIYVTEDKDIIERIRKDSKYNTEEIGEVSAEDEEVIQIKNKKMREADEEIKVKRASKHK